jgi:DNA uptake protein ComE-like DNA-binding protein
MFQYTYIATEFQPKKIDINQASFKILVAHPYSSYEKVQLIVNYRTKKSKFKDISELLELNILEKDTFEKLKPYLTV